MFYYCNADQIISDGQSIVTQFSYNLESFVKNLSDNAGNILWNLLSIIAIFLLARLVLALVSTITSAIMSREKYNTSTIQGKRMHTLMTLLRSVCRYAIYFLAFFAALGLLGFGKTLDALIVTAGIGSFAIGFGAQNLVCDVVTGLFMVFENQFAVGDYIKTDEAEGTVEAAAVRVTYLRSLKGDQIIIPNGSISRVVNYTRGGYAASVTIPTPYECDTRKLIDLIDKVVQQYAQDHEQLIEEKPVVLGVTGFTSYSVEIGVICKVKPMKQWEVERGMRLAVKELFDNNGITFPYPHMVTIPYSEPTEVVSYDDIFVTPRSTPIHQTSGLEDPLPDWTNIDLDDDPFRN